MFVPLRRCVTARRTYQETEGVGERDPYAVELAEFLLRTEGFAVEVATTPANAIDLFTSRAPALVIVEMLLGGGQGVALCRELKLSFFDPRMVGRSIFFEDLAVPLLEGGLGDVLERMDAVLREHRPGIVVIDSFKPFAAYVDDPRTFGPSCAGWPVG